MIKMFEEFGEDFYSEINWREYSLAVTNKYRMTINHKEIEHLKKLYGGDYENTGDYLTLNIINGNVYIIKTEDEWYYVNRDGSKYYHNKCYRCDQFEGLLKCLEEIWK